MVVVESPLSIVKIQMCCLYCLKLISSILSLFKIVFLWISVMSFCFKIFKVIFKFAKAPSISWLLLMISLLVNL